MEQTLTEQQMKVLAFCERGLARSTAIVEQAVREHEEAVVNGAPAGTIDILRVRRERAEYAHADVLRSIAADKASVGL